MGSIKNVLSEPIEEHEDYHMLVSMLYIFQACLCPDPLDIQMFAPL